MTERLLHATALLGIALGLALLLAAPNAAIYGWGHPLVPATVHLFTLGGILSAAYLLLARQWPRLYGPGAPWAPLLAAAWALHGAGVALLVWGLLRFDTLLAYVGGHYLVPTGIVLALAQGWAAAWRRPRGAPRRLAAHLPGLGLLVTMSLGALLVMDAHTGRYGIYSPHTILAHLLAAGFLFVLPLVLLPGALAADDAAAGSPAPLLRWYAVAASGAGGVLMVVLAGTAAGPPRMLPLGLAVLGALLVWLGLPGGAGARSQVPRLSGVRLLPLAGRLATGVLLFFAALRTARGDVPGEGLWLAKVGVLLFGMGLALPELLALLERDAGTPGTFRREVLWLTGTAALVAGQLWAMPWLVRTGALLWLAGLAWHAAASLRRA